MTQHSDLPNEPIPNVTEGDKRERVVYRITFRCGHTFQRGTYGTEAERQADVEQWQDGDCYACEHGIWELREKMLGEFMTGKDLS